MTAHQTKHYGRLLLSRRNDLLVAISIAGVALIVFILSPVRTFSDSAYTFVVSESILKHRSFALDHFNVPRQERKDNGSYVENGRIYQLEWVGDHLYYYYPPGSSVLSIPYVALMDTFGWSAINKDGSYNVEREKQLQLILASFLMALLGVVFYLTARLVLPILSSAVIAIGALFGTQVWSTLSSSVWSDTWGVFLVAVAVSILLAAHERKIRLGAVLLATLLTWAYFARPTNSVSLAGVTCYVLIYHRRLFLRFVITVAGWLSLFVAYSWLNFRKILPNYYPASRLTFEHFGEALAGNLISPSRGFLIYVPVTLFVLYLVVRYRKRITAPHLAVLAGSVATLHLVAISGWGVWHGGGSYGPRLMVGMLPWLVLIAILGVRAMRQEHAEASSHHQITWRLQYAMGSVLLVLSIVMNGIGATMPEVMTWNNRPVRIDRQPGRLWDWRYPQFLAGFLHPPKPQVFPPANVHVECGLPSAEPYLWYGWRETGDSFRWTDGRESTVVFAVDEISDVSLKIKMAPFIVSQKLERQRVSIGLNNHPLEALTLTESGPHEYSFLLPHALLGQRNVLSFSLPDATSPKKLQLNDDRSPLALAVYWIEIGTPGAKPASEGMRSAASGPLANGGYAAEIRVLDAPTEIKAGDSLTVRVMVKNISGVVWPGDGQNDHRTYRVRLGNHWRDSAGRLVLLDDGRAALPYDLNPGREVELLLIIKAPKIAGIYLLELDMVQEDVTWFADQDSETKRISIVVK